MPVRKFKSAKKKLKLIWSRYFWENYNFNFFLIETFKNNEACSYREPEKQIISRAGDECVVAVCDQEPDLD